MTAPQRDEQLVLSAVTGVMVGCLVLSLVTLLERYIPSWRPSYLPAFCALAAAEAAYSRYRSGKLPDLRFRLIELSTLLVVRQMWADVAEGRSPIQAGMPSFDPRQLGLFALASSFVYLSWLLAIRTAADFHDLGDSPEFYGPDLSPTRRLAPPSGDSAARSGRKARPGLPARG